MRADLLFYGHLYKPWYASALQRSSQSRRHFEDLAKAKSKRGNTECGLLCNARREEQREQSCTAFSIIIATAMTQEKCCTISSLFFSLRHTWV